MFIITIVHIFKHKNTVRNSGRISYLSHVSIQICSALLVYLLAACTNTVNVNNLCHSITLSFCTMFIKINNFDLIHMWPLNLIFLLQMNSPSVFSNGVPHLNVCQMNLNAAGIQNPDYRQYGSNMKLDFAGK